MTTRFILSFGIVTLGLSACSSGKDDGMVTSGTGAVSATTTAGSDDGEDGSDGGGDGGGADDGGDGGTDGGDEGAGETGSFIMDPDAGGADNECDVYAQDCPDGQKCMPWSNDGGGSWNATKCSDVDPNPGEPGDECTVEGGAVSGVDDCREGAMCYNVDPATNTGTCYELCSGSPDVATCNTPNTVCAIYNDGVLPMCYQECDPLLQDCAGPDLCLPSPNGDAYVCILDSVPNDEGGYGTPCEFVNVCDPGLFCANANVVPGCTTSGCCSEFCDLNGADPDGDCTGQADGQLCQPWWGEESPPPGYEHVGYCGIPL